MSTASDATKTGKLRLGGSNLWLFLLLASMILFGVNTGVATWQGSRLADAGSKAADLQVLSQQLANQGRDRKARPQPFTPDDFTPHGDLKVISLEQAMDEWA